MVDGFFQKAKEFFAGSNNEELDQDTNYSDREMSSAREDSYVDAEDQIYDNLSPAESSDEYSTPTDQDPYGDPADEYGYGR